MRTVFLLLTLILTLGLGVASAQSAEEAAVNNRVEGFFTAVAKGDVTGVAASFTENAVLAIVTNVSVGRANIESRARNEVGGGGLQITFTRHGTRLLSPTTAIVYGAFEIPSFGLKGHEIFTLVKEGNEWLIAALQSGATPPVQ